MQWPDMPRPSIAAAVTTASVFLAGTVVLVVVGVLIWNLHQNTLRLLQDQGEIALELLAPLARAEKSAAEMSEEIDDIASQFGAVGFVLDRSDRLLAHPHIRSDLVPAGARAADHDAIIALALAPAKRERQLTSGVVEGYLVWARGDDYGVFWRQAPNAPEWRVGIYLLRPATLSLLTPHQSILVAMAAGLLVIGAVLWWLHSRVLRPLAQLARTAELAADADIARATPLPTPHFSELERPTGAFNRMLASMKMMHGLTAGGLVRRLSREPKLLETRAHRVTILATALRASPWPSDLSTISRQADSLRRHLTLLSGRIAASGGVVVRYDERGALAVWGIGDDGPAETASAFQAAFAIRDYFRQENDAREEPERPRLKLAMAIVTGEVVAGNLGAAGEINFNLAGPAVDLAREVLACVDQAADDDEVVILSNTGEATPSGTVAKLLQIRSPQSATPLTVFRI